MSIRSRLFFFTSSIVLVSLFLGLSFLVQKDIFRSLDYNIMVNLQTFINRVFDLPLSFFTPLGSTEITFLIVVLIFITVLIKQRRLFLGLLLYFTIFIVEIAGKMLIFHPDPPEMFNRYALGFHFPSSFIVHTNFSYPSGHMARSSFVAFILLFFLLRGKIAWHKKMMSMGLLCLFTFGMFVSRIYLGEHWLSDVVGGLILGGSVATLAISLW